MQQFEQWLGGLPTRRLQGDACRSIQFRDVHSVQKVSHYKLVNRIVYNTITIRLDFS